MAVPTYSSKLLSVLLAFPYLPTYAVPAGFKAVIRSVTFHQALGGLTDYCRLETGYGVVIASALGQSGAESYTSYLLHVVQDAGDVLGFSYQGTWSATVSGFLLSLP